MSEGALAPNYPHAPQPMLRLLSDARLAGLAARGSAPAFAAIYQRHHQDVYRYCRSILRDEDDARDALQNTMVKALDALEGETREIALRPWLFRIAHNESISLIRRRSPDVSIDQVAEVAADEDNAEARSRLQGLIADLELLTERQRSALVMRELSGLEFKEIGVSLETSPEGAKQAVYEARMALRELEQARAIDCDEIRRRISADDRRRLRARAVRAHMKSCSDCREFAQQIRSRSGQLAAIAPPLPAAAAIGILEGILGGGGGGGGAAAAAAGGGGGALAGFGGGAALKLGAAAVIAAGVGGVALEANGSNPSIDRRAPAAISSAAQPGEVAVKGAHSNDDGGAGGSGDAARAQDEKNSQGGSGEAGGAGNGNRDGASAQGANGGGAAPPANASDGTTPVADTPGSSSQGVGPTGTPPGQGGTPPGLSSAPPGQGGTPPGQGGTPPGLSGVTPPGLGTTPTGQGGSPPGLGGNLPPGLGGALPGQGGAPLPGGPKT